MSIDLKHDEACCTRTVPCFYRALSILVKFANVFVRNTCSSTIRMQKEGKRWVLVCACKCICLDEQFGLSLVLTCDAGISEKTKNDFFSLGMTKRRR